MTPKWKDRIQQFSFAISSIAVLISVISIFLTVQIFKHQQTKDSADLVLRFDDVLDKPKYADLIDSLDTDDKNAKILQSDGGIFTDELVDDYLGQYETLAVLYRENLIDHEMANQVFSYDLEEAYQNAEIQKHIKEEDKFNNDLWTGFIYLAKEFQNKK